MHGFPCRAAVQSGCDLSSALTPLPGRAATAGTAAPQGGTGAIPNGPPAEASPSGRQSGPFIKVLPFTSTKMTRVNLHKWGIPSQMGRFWPFFVMTSESTVRNASHKLEIWSQQKSPLSLIFNSQNLQLLCLLLHDFSRYL